jgi:hypothetical protein
VALANTLTGLIPTLYEARNIISRELTGFIPSVLLDTAAARVATGQPVRVNIVPKGVANDIVPAMTPPTPNGQAMSYIDMTIQKNRAVWIPWNGDEQLSVNENGVSFNSILRDQFAEAMRTLTNEIETDLAGLFTAASRAYGTAGNTPFASNLADPAQVRKILDDNGCPPGDRQLVIDTSAGAALRTLAQLTKANEAGTQDTLTQGVLLDIHGFKIRESAKVAYHTKGTGSGYLVNNGSNIAAGSTSIDVDTGTGTILAGDVLTDSQSGVDSNKYVVKTALSAGNLTINNPGTLKTWVNNDTLAVGNSYTANLAFHRNALALLARMPALPGGRDMATDRMQLSDPVTGLVFDVAEYAGFHQMFYEVGIAWGVAAVKSEHIALLLG